MGIKRKEKRKLESDKVLINFVDLNWLLHILHCFCNIVYFLLIKFQIQLRNVYSYHLDLYTCRARLSSYTTENEPCNKTSKNKDTYEPKSPVTKTETWTDELKASRNKHAQAALCHDLQWPCDNVTNSLETRQTSRRAVTSHINNVL